MKALEKDRTRRYATAQQLADDIERYLSSQPVMAGPPIGPLPHSEVRAAEPRTGYRRGRGPSRPRRRSRGQQRALFPRRAGAAARRHADARRQARQRVPHRALRGLGPDRSEGARGHGARAARQGRHLHERDERSAGGAGDVDGHDGSCLLHTRPLRSGGQSARECGQDPTATARAEQPGAGVVHSSISPRSASSGATSQEERAAGARGPAHSRAAVAAERSPTRSRRPPPWPS